MKLPESAENKDFMSFDPYAIFDKDKNRDLIKQLGLDFVTKKLQKPLYSLITQGDPIFSMNDIAIAGLVRVWQGNTRRKNKILVSNLIQYHIAHPILNLQTGLYTLMILSSVRIGKTTLAWYKQLNNPIRANVVKSMIVNIPKSIAEGSNYFTNIGKDVISEQTKACEYYFDEFNKTLMAYLCLTCYYLKKDVNDYIKELEDCGYLWLDYKEPFTEEMYEQLFKFHFPDTSLTCANQTIKSVYRDFSVWENQFRFIYHEIDSVMNEYYEYVRKHGAVYLESFKYFEEKEKGTNNISV